MANWLDVERLDAEKVRSLVAARARVASGEPERGSTK
jgi:hypothetical protein